MSPKLKPLLLPQLVEERKLQEVYPALIHSLPLLSQSQAPPPPPPPTLSTQQLPTITTLPLKQQQQQQPQIDVSYGILGPYALATTNSSSSDVASPLTPTFSARGHVRYSSSTSSLDLPPLPLLQDSPASPALSSATINTSASKSNVLRPLPDVQEEPMERDSFDSHSISTQHFGLYSCLCDEPCEHRNSTDDFFPGGIVSDFDIDYDMGFLSDGDYTADTRQLKKKRSGTTSPLTELTNRLSSRFPTIQRWRSGRRSRNVSAGPVELSFEDVLSRAPSSRSSSISAIGRLVMDRSIPPTPALPQLGSAENVSTLPTNGLDWPEDHRTSIERDRTMTTTPLLPPLLTGAIAEPPVESPLQSPTVEPASFLPDMYSSTPNYSRPSLSTRQSTTSLRQISNSTELPMNIPGLVQEHDEWSDRLGHANFTISPQPYDLPAMTPDAVTKFCEDWDTARVNYTKHLVRTGENYGQTSNIYAMTEAKWAEIERKWNTVYEDILRRTQPPTSTTSKNTSRSRSRGRGRGRSTSATGAAALKAASEDNIFAGVEWRRLEDCLPSAVPQMLEALDADGKFPNRGDEDIVGPMQRDAFMVGAYVEDSKTPRFWRNLVDKVGLSR